MQNFYILGARYLSLLCREYQVDWLTKKIKKFIIEKESKRTGEILQYLALSEEMDFGASLNENLINELKEPFPIIQMCPEFMSLTLKMQVSIARKRLWLLLRGHTMTFYLALNVEDIGLMSIFKEQSEIDFKYNATEKEMIERCRKDGKSKKEK